MTPEEWAEKIVERSGSMLPSALEGNIIRAIREAVAAERETCARVAASFVGTDHNGVCDPGYCAACDRNRAVAVAIRARG